MTPQGGRTPAAAPRPEHCRTGRTSCARSAAGGQFAEDKSDHFPTRDPAGSFAAANDCMLRMRGRSLSVPTAYNGGSRITSNFNFPFSTFNPDVPSDALVSSSSIILFSKKMIQSFYLTQQCCAANHWICRNSSWYGISAHALREPAGEARCIKTFSRFLLEISITR